MSRDDLEDLEQARLAKEYQRQREEIWNNLWSAVGVRPVQYGFGWVEEGNPSTIMFEEAMISITKRVNKLKSELKNIKLSQSGGLSEL